MASEQVNDSALSAQKDKQLFYAQINYKCPYVQPLLLAALASQLPAGSYSLVPALPTPLDAPLLQILQYEELAFALAADPPSQQKVLVNAYVIRKALIRKHFLAATVAQWTRKHPDSILATNVGAMCELEVDYAEFLDEALSDAFELRDSLAANAEKSAAEREWWILKPGMGDGGDGIRLFSTEEELTDIFEAWEEADDDDDDDAAEASDDDDAAAAAAATQDPIRTSQMRHFVAQPYLTAPLLLPSHARRKFHVRAYAVAVGGLRVFVHRPMLALFARDAYAPPWEEPDLGAHLTNTCFGDGAVAGFWDLDDGGGEDGGATAGLGAGWKEDVFRQICACTGEVFEAAARNMVVHFQAVPFAFEVFGLDYLVDAAGRAWLLEVNAFPDFRQTGDGLKDVIGGLFEEVVNVAVRPFFLGDEPAQSARLVKVLDIDTGHR
jgi:hypothetical protein